MMKNIKIIKSQLYYLALVCILLGNLCFYDMESMNIYIIMCGGGIGITFLVKLISEGRHFRFGKGFLWLTAVYGMYMIYGFWFIRTGEYNWDSILFHYLGGVAIYYILSDFAMKENWHCKVANICMLVVIITAAYIVFTDSEALINNFMYGESTRIGDALSGNVNTVGVCLGILTLFVMYEYCITRQKKYMLTFFISTIFMLLTGSKKALIVLMFVFIIYFSFEKKQVNKWIKVLFIAIVGIYVVFFVEPIYEVIGSRVLSMIDIMFLNNRLGMFSNSTQSRISMIEEGFAIMWNYPIFGGGYNYYRSMNATGYYSHCNYIEIICSYGLVGTILYYGTYVRNLFRISRNRKYKPEKAKFAIILLIVALILDWTMVGYLSLCILYIPIIFSFVVIESMKKEQKNGK